MNEELKFKQPSYITSFHGQNLSERRNVSLSYFVLGREARELRQSLILEVLYNFSDNDSRDLKH